MQSQRTTHEASAARRQGFTDLLCHGTDEDPGCRQPVLRFMRRSSYALHGAVILRIDPAGRITIRCERDDCGAVTTTRGHAGTRPHRVRFVSEYDPSVPADLPVSIRDMGYPSLESMLETMQQRWDDFRVTKLRTRGVVAVGLRFDVFMRDGFRCRYCGVSIDDGAILHADHVIPQSKGGATTLENLVTACMDCNLGKSDKDLG